MRRNALLAAALGAVAMLAAAASATAANKTEFEYLRERQADVDREIRDVAAKIKREIRATLANDIKRTVRKTDSSGKPVEEQVGTIDMDRIDKLLSGQVQADDVRKILGETETAVGGAKVWAKEIRDKLAEYRRPLDVIDAQIAAKQKEWDRLEDLGYEIDLWGAISVVGTYGDQMRVIQREMAKLQEDREKALEEVNKKIQADPDVTFRNLEAFEAAVDRAYRSYYDNQVPGGVEVKQLLAELGRLVAERDRIADQLKSGSMYVVWYNDVGWVHVGTVEQRQREDMRARGSEIWGGLGGQPLKNTTILNAKGYATLEEAVKAVGAAAGGSVKHRPSPLASPTSFYEGDVAGDKRKIGFEIINHPAFKEWRPTD